MLAGLWLHFAIHFLQEDDDLHLALARYLKVLSLILRSVLV